MENKNANLILVFLVAAVLLAGLIWATGDKTAKYAVENHYHVVSDGETVWDIAWDYLPKQKKTKDVRELIDDIGKANKLLERSWNIRPGDELIIPLLVEVKKEK